MKIRLITFLVLFFSLCSVSTTGQSFKGSLTIENVTLPQGGQLVYSYQMAQDSMGLIWFLSGHGRKIHTYNGHELSMVEDDELGFHLYACEGIYSNKSGSLFCLPQDSLMLYNPVTKSLIRKIGPAKIAYPPSGNTEAKLTKTLGGPELLVIGDNQVIWALANSQNHVEGRSSYVLRAEKGQDFQLVDSLVTSWYYDRCLERDGHFFVKLRNRIEEFDARGRVQIYSFPDGPDPVMPSIVKDAENTIWVVHSPDKAKDQFVVYYLKEGQKAFVRLPEGEGFPQEEKFGKLFADGQYIWHRGTPFRLSRRHIKHGTVEDFTDKIIKQRLNFPFYESTLLNMFRDQSGELWLTTRAGTVKLSIEEDIFQIYDLHTVVKDCSGDNCMIKGVTEDENGKLYLSYVHGIVSLDPQTGILSAIPTDIPAQPQKTHALSYANQTLFWNEYMIDLRTAESRKIVPLDEYDYITHTMDPDGKRLWFAVNDLPLRFFEYNIQTKGLRELNAPREGVFQMNSEVRKMIYSPSTNSLFLGMWMNGLLEMDLAGNILHTYTSLQPKTPEMWPSNAMYELYLDKEDQLWGGHGGGDAGLSKMDLKTREITVFPYQVKSSADYLQRVFRILPGKEGFLWLVTERGIRRLDSKRGILSSFPMFSTMGRIAFNNLPAYKASNGILYIGTLDGKLNSFDPKKLDAKARLGQIFPIALHRYDRYNEKQDTLITQLKDLIHLSEIHLGYQDRYFELDFSIPDYRNTQKNLYTYWLEGYEKDWSVPGRSNQLRYENLPPGTYTLHIRGGLIPDYYESSERVLTVVVHRAWYKTWWAWSLYLGVFLGLIYLFYRFQVRQQLKKAEARRLKELDALKSRLYTNITHEFRTPLTVIMGMTNNIGGHEKEKNLITRNSKNLLRLINQLLDLSKLDSGKLKLDTIQADVINYAQYLTESFYSMAEEKKIRLTFYPEVKELVMDYDEMKIQHIIHNLLTNAIKFTPEGGKVILHVKEIEQRGEAHLQIKVSDTGIGIAEENLPKIFDRFFQGDASATRKEAGTGIGLALTKELVEMMEGSITVQSKLGVGTDFQIALPIKKEDDTLKQDRDTRRVSLTLPKQGFPEAGPELLRSLPTHNFRKDSETPSLLIIEDNHDVVTYIESLLHNLYRIEIAHNGREGIEKALDMVPDIIISDVMMPEKDGYEVCQTLKSDSRSSHIPIILLTAKAAPEDRIEGLKGGADAYLTKPFDKEELFVRLEKLINLRKQLQSHYAQSGWLYKQADPTVKEPSLDDLFIQKLIQVVQDRLDDPELEVADLCEAAHLSNMQVNRKLKALTGKTPSRFIRSVRLEKAVELLQNSSLTVSEIAYEVGFSNPNYFSRSFSEEFGRSPSSIRK